MNPSSSPNHRPAEDPGITDVTLGFLVIIGLGITMRFDSPWVSGILTEALIVLIWHSTRERTGRRLTAAYWAIGILEAYWLVFGLYWTTSGLLWSP